MTGRRWWVGAAAVAALALSGAPASAGASARAPAAVDDACTPVVSAPAPPRQAEAASRPLELMQVDAARAVLDRDASPSRRAVRVAVVDSGVADSPLLPVVRRVGFTGLAELRYGHGTAVAGLIAGQARPDGQAVGVDPDAEIVDVRVYDEAEPTDPAAVGVEPARVAAGLRWVADHARELRIGVVNVSLRVTDDPALASAVRALRRADVVVVAATGNRPADDADPLLETFGAPSGREDAAAFVFPAGYPGVLGVNATSGVPSADDRGSVLQSSATDVAAPTPGAVTVTVDGGTCVVGEVATSWAAAEVSGVVALLRARFPDETAEQIVARLVQTAGAAPGSASPLVGAGVVQPVEALTRPLRPTRRGELVEAVQEPSRLPPATAPEPHRDQLAGLHEVAPRWGLGAGAAVVIALLLRPLLDRRRG